ncbi:MAG: rod shape-determining protein MreC [Patescibacteria group bacterium]
MIKIKKNNPLLIFTVVLGLLVFLHVIGIIRPIEKAFLFLMKPLSARLYEWGTGFGSAYDERRTKEELLAEVAYLKNEIASSSINNSHWLEIESENKKLRGQLGFISNNKFKAVLANIIAKDESFSVSKDVRDIIIDKGEKDGLRPELGVLSEEGVIIGKIVETNSINSRVCLITSPGCQLAASLQNEDKTKGITDGNLGLTIEMSYIPQLEKISIGNMVVTSGLGGGIPRGLIIGRVSNVTSESNEVWQSATIEPLIDFSDLTVVSIIIP